MRQHDDRVKSHIPKGPELRHVSRQRTRVPIVVSLAVLVALAGLACSSQSSTAPPKPTSTDTPTSPTVTTGTTSQYSQVTGTVTQAASGQPYGGATVEFVNLPGDYQLNTKTDESGRYSIELPSGLYRAEALDESNLYTDFEIAGGSSDTITVPPAANVDFLESPIQ